jgi:GDP-mannose 6-dehydrogenase
MRISIFGLGYVGAVSAACLARDGHSVIGCDLDPVKLDLIRSGRTPIIERGMQELVAAGVDSGRLKVTDDADRAVADSDISFICVGTPASPNGSQSLDAIRRVFRRLGEALRPKTEFHTFVLRSTVIPGTVEDVIKPILEETSGKRAGTDFGLCFQPEFLREGSSIRDYDNPPLTLVGVDSDRAANVLRELFRHLPCKFVTTTVRTAEMMKYACNAFHALKITFANEIGRISQAFGVDPHAVMGLVCEDKQLNISTAYLKPGFAFGGSCLPKDLKALIYAARHHDVETPMLSGVLQSNAIHIEHAIEIVLNTQKKSIGMVGLSFKGGTDDLRESPLVGMAERFIGKGLDLKIHDPEVNVSRLVGANRRYIEQSIPHIASLMTSDCADVVRDRDIVVVGLRDEALLRSVYDHCNDDQIIVDLVNIPERDRLRGSYLGVCW